jgi:tRNA threonylcarbamoyladenosine biosynthesis protein TsaB
MNLLAIDSASSILSIAAAKGEDIHCSHTEAEMKHSQIVMECIESQMKKAELKPNELDGVLCMGGPGSFTGLRIGYSIAKGLALCLSIPFASVPTLDCVAFSCRGGGPVLAVIEAVKNAYFFAFYRDGGQLKPAEDGTASKIAGEIDGFIKAGTEKITITGPGSASLYDSLSPEQKGKTVLFHENRGYAGEIISIAKIRKIPDNDITAFLYSGPEYIRKTDAEINLSGSAGNKK